MIRYFSVILLSLLVLSSCIESSSGTLSDQTNQSNQNFEAELARNGHDTLGLEVAKLQVKETIEGKGQPFTWDTLIKNRAVAIAVAEPILFEIFGKEQILSERPYEVYLIDGYWYLSGTIPKESNGGGFEIILSSRNGQIIRVTHYK